jgi:hypothetical protein
VPQLARPFLRSRSIMSGDGPGNPVLDIVLISEARFKPNLAAASFGPRITGTKLPSEGLQSASGLTHVSARSVLEHFHEGSMTGYRA